MTKYFLLLSILFIAFELKGQHEHLSSSLPDHPAVISVQEDETIVPLKDLKPVDYDHLLMVSPGSTMGSALFGSNGYKNGVVIFSGDNFKGKSSPFYELMQELNLASHPVKETEKTPFSVFIKTILENPFERITLEMDEKPYSLKSAASLSNIEPEWIEELEVSTVYKRKNAYYELRLTIFESFRNEIRGLDLLQAK